MPLIVDTYNVLHVVGVLPPDLAGVDVRGLADLLRTSRFRDEATVLVCDGKPRPPRGGAGPRRGKKEGPLGSGAAANVRIRYSGPRATADDLIIALIRTSSEPRRITIVSSDHEILRAARRRRCRTITSPEFLGQLASDRLLRGKTPRPAEIERPPGMLPEDDVAKWAKIFALDPDQPPPALPPTSPDVPASPASNRAPTKGDGPPNGTAGPPGGADDGDAADVIIPDEILREAESIWEGANPDADGHA